LKRFLICAVSGLFTLFAAVPAFADSSLSSAEVSAKAAILIEAGSGRVLYEKNADQPMPMASTTKIMTAILAIEKSGLDDTVVVGKNASGVEGSSIWLSVGEKMSLSDMLFGLMLASGNDAAIAIAEHVSGSVDAFAELMTARARELGAKNTNFMNPNGLPDDNHYTTAHDLALITAHAMQLPFFCEVVKTQYKKIPWEGHEWDRVVKNKNKILWNYEGGNGVKTGFTKKAGRCLSAAAERDGMQLVSVVLNAPDMFGDCMAMMDYGFSNYQNQCILEADTHAGRVKVLQGVDDGFDVYTPQDIRYPLTAQEAARVETRITLEPQLRAPVRKGQQVGSVQLLLNGRLIYEQPLFCPVSIGENSYTFNLGRLIDLWIGRKILDMAS